MSIEETVQKHMKWKTEFRSAISNKETMDAAPIGKDNYCMVGLPLMSLKKVLNT